MHKGVVYRLFMCESLSPRTSPVLMSHWVDYEVLGSAQESFLTQVQVSSRCLPMCHSDLAAMPAIRGCKPSFHLFPYSRYPRMKTRAHGRGDVCTQETVQQKVWEQRWDLNFSSSSGSPQQCPLSSGFHLPAHGSSCWAHTAPTSLFLSAGLKFPFWWHTVVVVKTFWIHTVLKTLIQNAGELALFSPTAWGSASSRTLILEVQASSPVAMLVSTGEQGELPPSFWTCGFPGIFLGTHGTKATSQGTG